MTSTVELKTGTINRNPSTLTEGLDRRRGGAQHKVRADLVTIIQDYAIRISVLTVWETSTGTPSSGEK
jgi:hypothetical protein